MTLRDWKQKEGIPWHEVARRVGVTQNRLSRLRAGTWPKHHEYKALLRITDNEVKEFI